MSLDQQIEKLKAIRREADAIFDELEVLSKTDSQAPPALLTQLRTLVAKLDATARLAARKRRKQIIGELNDRIRQYDTLLSLNLSPPTRASAEAERATLVARRGYHRGRLGLDFEGVVSKDEADGLAMLLNEVNAAADGRRVH